MIIRLGYVAISKALDITSSGTITYTNYLKEENKDDNLEVIDAYDGVISDLKNMISDIKDIKTKAKENAKNKYKKKIDNTKFDLIDAFDGPDGAALKEKLEEKIIRENSKMNNNRNIKRPGK